MTMLWLSLRKFWQKRGQYTIIIALTLLIIFPRRGGYFMLLDFVSIPEIDYLTKLSWSEGLMWNILHIVGFIVWPIVLQYMLYCGALVLLWYWAAIRAKQLQLWSCASYFAIMFAMINPFIYARMMDGQYNVFLGTAGILWLMFFLFRVVTDTQYPASWLWRAWIVAWMTVSLLSHSIFFVALLSTCLLLWTLSRHKKLFRRFSFLTIVLLLNSNRIIAGLTGKSSVGMTMTQIDDRHVAAFSTKVTDGSVWFKLASLHGFWGEQRGRFANTFFSNPDWKTLFVVLFVIILYGMYYAITASKKERRSYAIRLIMVWFVAYLLAIGVSSGWILAHIVQFLYEYFPGYIGLREPQKWLSVVLIVYVLFWAFGVQAVVNRLQYHDLFRSRLILPIVVLLPLLYTPTMLFAMKWQLRARDYPAGRYAMKEQLHTRYIQEVPWLFDPDCERDCFRVLVFPWHQYMRFRFTRSVIANPIADFFAHRDGRVVSLLQWDNMEMGDIYTQSLRPASKIIERYVWPSWAMQANDLQTKQQFIASLKDLGIKAILVFKEIDRKQYRVFLESVQDAWYLHLAEENDDLMFYVLD